ncbi:MAG: hypothetical protein KDA32_09055 [Phycisphaerales bacterium]|nr:hypothetical protein [Phycisphaerales bacterium]
MRRILIVVAAAIATPALIFGAPTIDGRDIPADFLANNGIEAAKQRYLTAFGNSASPTSFGFGSELNKMYLANDNVFLYVGLTGNLENNGNCVVLFFDVDDSATGADVLDVVDANFVEVPGLPRFLTGANSFDNGLDEMSFDTDDMNDPGDGEFVPNFCLGFTGGSPVGSQTRSYYLVNWTTLADHKNATTAAMGRDHSNVVLGLMTDQDPMASGPNGKLGSIFPGTIPAGFLGASDDTNVDGVKGGSALNIFDPNSDPNTATTGFEFAIPLTQLRVSTMDPKPGPGDVIKIFAMVSSTTGFAANQLLPTDDTSATLDNLGADGPNFNMVPGEQYYAYTLVSPCPVAGCTADLNDDCRVGLEDLAGLLSAFGTTAADANFIAGADLDGSGTVDLSDLAGLLAQFGQDCN